MWCQVLKGETNMSILGYSEQKMFSCSSGAEAPDSLVSEDKHFFAFKAIDSVLYVTNVLHCPYLHK